LTPKLEHHYRFYLQPDAFAGEYVRFAEAESGHMVSSLRVKAGVTVAATDGRGGLYRILVERVEAGRVEGRVLESVRIERASPVIHLFQGIVRPSRMDLIVEKCTELGAAAFVPVVTERSVRLGAGGRTQRLARIAAEAMKQSLGVYLPQISEPVVFEQALDMLVGIDLSLVASECSGERRLAQVIADCKARAIAIWVGPEGGFTSDESNKMASYGALRFSLGPKRLRSETAAIVSVALINEAAAAPDTSPRTET
jgi:16S rRNA (uracil1498-N3)-methyltransferase